MTATRAFEASLKNRTVGQLNGLLDGAVAAQDLGKTSLILEAFQKSGKAAMIDTQGLDDTSEAIATLCRRVKSQALGG